MGATVPAPIVFRTDKPAILQCHVSWISGHSTVQSAHSPSATTTHMKGSLQRIHQRASALSAPQTSLLWRLVSTQAQRAGVAAAARSCGMIVMRRGHQGNGYLVPPAVMDSGLHLGSALVAQVQPAGSSEGTPVPVAFGSYAATAELKAPASEKLPACAAAGQSPAPGDIPRSSYNVAGGVVHLLDLQARPFEQHASTWGRARGCLFRSMVAGRCLKPRYVFVFRRLVAGCVGPDLCLEGPNDSRCWLPNKERTRHVRVERRNERRRK